MNPFHTNPIQSLQKKDRFYKKILKAESWIHSHRILSVLALIFGLLTLKGVYGAIDSGHPISVKQIIIEAVGNSLETDGKGRTNILLIGVGGEGHDGENLTDTMIVASIDESTPSVSMISIPRDFYVENERIGWGTRINSLYEYVYDETEDPLDAEAVLEKQIEEVLDVDIQYYAKIDFQGFTDVVDAIGGITVNVTESIADQSYPAPAGSTALYDPFYLSAGTHTLDGETALKYVRSRHSSSDFGRAERQQEVIEAIKDQALSVGMLTSPGKIKDLYFVISNNFETNLSLTELASLASVGKNLDTSTIQSAVFNDLAYTKGGFLYTPEREEGDPYYLAPYSGDFSELALFAELAFYHPEVIQNQVPIRVLNGTKVESLAGLTKMLLIRYGFNVVSYANADSKDIPKTHIYLLPQLDDAAQEEVENTARMLPLLIDGEITEDVPPSYQSETEAEIIIELGADFGAYYKENEKLFYIGFY